MSEGIMSAIGRTPLVRLKRVIKDIDFRLYAKLEGLNPGGSMKDRPAFVIIKHAMKSGLLKPGATVIESSSGNMGIGFAQACLYFGLKFIRLAEQFTCRRDFIRCTSADILRGAAPARKNNGDLVIFSPFGLGVLDLAVGKLIYDLGIQQLRGTVIESFLPEPWSSRER